MVVGPSLVVGSLVVGRSFNMSQHSLAAIPYWKEFFKMYRSMPELWQVGSFHYRDRALKDQSYGRLLDYLRLADPHANIHTLKRKINNFRTSFRRELRKVQESDNYVPTLWYFRELELISDLENGNLSRTGVSMVQDHDMSLEQEDHEDQADISGFQMYKKSPEIPTYMQPHDGGLEENPGVDIIEESQNDSVDQMANNEEDMSEHEEDVLRLATVVDNEPEPEPEVETTEPDQEIEQKVFVYESMAMAGNNNIITNNSYANQSSFSHIQHDSPASITTDTSNNRRNRIRRRRSTNETDYVEDAKARRTDLMIPDASRARDRERDRDRENDSENECELIGRRMASHFRHMRQDQRLYAERIISEVLVYGRMNRLSFESRFIPEG
ncbi:uncharacterized protein LOC108103941 isoform X2 [Drosophila eugracilis]|uniref:uncharacterized protein LOC108103941 isoform X2 n=1 Tax=Drosophila eugracilis TaxID=29029 RepID=UPI0007E84892|nr:uncharacterized protein LOC108103941 isoform X2 [Drosophila eugracilis]